MEDRRDQRDPQWLAERMWRVLKSNEPVGDMGDYSTVTSMLEAADMVVGNHGGGTAGETYHTMLVGLLPASPGRHSRSYVDWLKAQALEQARVHHGQLERAGKALA